VRYAHAALESGQHGRTIARKRGESRRSNLDIEFCYHYVYEWRFSARTSPEAPYLAEKLDLL
jgi:hypothetical protein